MWIKKFSNQLIAMQLQLIAKQEKQSISEEVKRSKFLKHLPQYMEYTLIPQIKEYQTYKNLVQQAECYEGLKGYIAVLTTTTCTPWQRSTKPHNSDCNRLQNGRQQQKTCFNSSNNNPSNQLAKSHPSNNFNWDTITRNLDQKTKIELF